MPAETAQSDSNTVELFISLVCTVNERREELLELFEYIVDNHNDFDNDAVHSADGYIALLTGFEFCFLLATFNSVGPILHPAQVT